MPYPAFENFISDAGYKRLIGLLLFIVLVLGFFSLGSWHRGDRPSATLTSPEEIRWSERIDEVGVKQAYQEYKQEGNALSITDQHNSAHVMGRVLYVKLGLDGLSICDSSFSFGCYHSFFALALSEKGSSIVEKLDQVCLNNYGPYGTGCQHGIGHGLLEYYGHRQIARALEDCNLTTRVSPLMGCSSGVFMEYNFPIVIGENFTSAQTRALDKEHPYDPCPNVEESFRSSCYYELAQWWSDKTVYNDDYSQMGKLCYEIKDEADRQACFLGVGYIAAPFSEYAVETVVGKCQKMPDAESQVLCRAGASWGFFSVEKQRPLATKLCENMSSAQVSKCLSFKKLVGISNL